MALPKQVVPLFGDARHAAKGSDAGVDPHHAQVDWLIAENAIYPRRDAISKRTGTDRGASTYTAPTMAKLGDTPVLFGNGSFLRYIPDEDDTRGTDQDESSAYIFDTDVQSYGASRSTSLVMDCYDGGTWIAVAYGLGVLVFDKDSKTILDSITYADASQTRFCKVGSKNQIYSSDGSGVTGATVRDIASDGTIGGGTTVDLNAVSTSYAYLDACTVGSNTVTVHAQSATVWEITTMPSGLPASKSQATIYTTTGTLGLVACWPISTTQVGVLYSYTEAGSTYLKTLIYNATTLAIDATVSTLATETSATDEILSACGLYMTADTESRVFWSTRGVPTGSDEEAPKIDQKTVDESGGAVVLSGGATTYNARLWSKPAPSTYDDGECIVGTYVQSWNTFNEVVADDAYTQATCLFTVFGDGTASKQQVMVCGRMLPGVARTSQVFLSSLGDPQAGGTYYAAATKIVEELVGYDTNEVRVMTVIGADFDAADQVDVIEVGGAALVGGSCPYYYTGAQVFESGFLQYISPIGVEVTGSIGGLTVGSTYYFKIVLEQTDLLGRIHRGTPTPLGDSFTPLTFNQTDLDIHMRIPPMTNRQGSTDLDAVRGVLYRTTGDEETYYREVEAYFTSTPGEDTTMNSTAADADLEDGRVLYTDDNILEYRPAPPFRVGCLHINRIFVAFREEESTTIRYSQELNDIDAPNFHEDLEIRIPEEGGRITGLVSQGGRLFALKEEGRIYAVYGNPAAADGSGAQWAVPVMTSAAVGCSDHRSIVHTQVGTMWAAQDYTIWKDPANPTPVGDRQRYYTETYGPVIGAATLPEQNIVVFALEGAGAPLLVYNWLFDKWAQWPTRSDTVAITAIDNVLYRLDDSGYIWQGNPATYADDDGTANYISLRLRTGDIHKGSTPDGWQMVDEVMIGGYKHGADGFNMRLKAAYNQETYFIDSKTFDASTLTGFDHTAAYGAGSATYEGESFSLKLQPRGSKMQCSSIQIEVSDEEGDDGAQQGYTLTSASLRVGLKPGTKRVGRTRHVTG